MPYNLTTSEINALADAVDCVLEEARQPITKEDRQSDGYQTLCKLRMLRFLELANTMRKCERPKIANECDDMAEMFWREHCRGLQALEYSPSGGDEDDD